MSFRLVFQENTPTWTKLGTAELFRILTYPMGIEKEVKELADGSGITFHLEPYYLEAPDESTLNNFFVDTASWYTRNKLSFNSNYDLLLKHNDNQEWVISETPISRPSTLRQVPSNSSNIKPVGTKEVKREELSSSQLARIDDILKQGIAGIPPEKFKNLKIYKTERYIDFNVIPTSGKKDVCFSCGAHDYLTEAKETQHPLTVGISNYGNFYSYHSGKIGFCRVCALSNHLSLGKVFYYNSQDNLFLAIPETNSIKSLIRLFSLLNECYESKDFEKFMQDNKGGMSFIADNSSLYRSNFISTKYWITGFYFMILVLFFTLQNSIDFLSFKVQQEESLKDNRSGSILELIPEQERKGGVSDYMENLMFNSWSFILQDNNTNIRHWRLQTSKSTMEYLRELKRDFVGQDLIGIVYHLSYKIKDNWINRSREEFSRSILLKNPEIEFLERFCWDKMLNGGQVEYGIRLLGERLFIRSIKVDKMEKEDVLKQCKGIGIAIAELANADGKSLLYELRSVGNSQAFRGYLERFTFSCSMAGKKTNINTEFLEYLLDGTDWKKYKSIIAIVANQHYSYLTSKKQEVVAN